MQVKKDDFIEFDFIGKLKESGQIFDLSSEEEAKKENIFNPRAEYKPLIIQAGRGDVVKGLDKELIGKEVGKKYIITVSPEEGFGAKNGKLVQLVPSNVFKKQNINPYPGMQVTINNMMGTIRTVSGGRVMVDFNHPLAGKILEYDIKINRILTDDGEKIKAFLEFHLDMRGVDFELKENNLEIKYNLPKPLQTEFIHRIKEILPALKSIEFKTTDKE